MPLWLERGPGFRGFAEVDTERCGLGQGTTKNTKDTKRATKGKLLGSPASAFGASWFGLLSKNSNDPVTASEAGRIGVCH